MEKTKYRIRLGIRLLAVFVLGWIVLAGFFGITTHPPAFLLFNAPLFPFYMVFTCSRNGAYWFVFLLIVTLMTSVLLPFLKQKWAKIAYFTAATIIVYWICCALIMQGILLR